MPSFNEVTLVGVIGDKPVIRASTNGVAYTVYSLCTHSVFKSKVTAEKVEHIDWHTLISWGTQAEAVTKYLTKGNLVFVKGKLSTRVWEDDNEKSHKTRIVTDQVLFLENRNTNNMAQDTVPLN